MHQPRPFGLFGKIQSDDDGAAVELLARRLTNVKTLGGLDSLRMIQTLPSGGIAIAQDMGGVFKVFVRPRLEEPEAAYEPQTSPTYLPMLFSGRISKPTVEPKEPVELVITKDTQRRLKQYDQEKKKDGIAPERLELQRFVVKHGVAFQELVGGNNSTLIRTQYTNQHPTWYSGAMAEVVQIAAGYGRSDDDLPKGEVKLGQKKNPMQEYERLQMTLPPKWLAKLNNETIDTRVPGATGMPPKSGEIQFDYKFDRTHGVGFDDKGKPWLLQISVSGVHAMPLPLVPATTTKTFRAYIEEVGDSELLWILDRFGGMPSGEGFPPAKEGAFAAWVRAGAIVRVCGTADFYANFAYSPACGWSFNSSGTEGFNTCHNYAESGVCYGLAYKLSLSLVAADESASSLSKEFHQKEKREADLLDAYLGALYLGMGNENKSKHRAIKYKLMRRMSVGEVLARAQDYFRFLSASDGGNKIKQEIDYWDNVEAAPIAKHKGSVAQVGRGWLYTTEKYKFQPQIKFPDPLLEGCVSFDFTPMEGDGKDQPKCDTIMYGYYIGDSLKVVKYFRDDKEKPPGVDCDLPDCMTVGSWEQFQTHSPSRIVGPFYTSDFDEREEIAEETSSMKIVGTDLGYDSKPCFEFDHPLAMAGTIYRRRFYQHEYRSESSGGNTKNVGVCIPFLSRNAVLYATVKNTKSGKVQESREMKFITDPHIYRMWTFDWAFHWVGGLDVMTGKPAPKEANPVWVEYEYWGGGKCSDFADQGSWITGFPADYTWLVHPEAGVYNYGGNGGAPTINEYSKVTLITQTETGKLELSLTPQPHDIGRIPNEWYFTVSPDAFGLVFYKDATKVVAGKASYASCSEPDPAAPLLRKRFGFTRMATHTRAHFFIGVINE